jgi:hypothetical protein
MSLNAFLLQASFVKKNIICTVRIDTYNNCIKHTGTGTTIILVSAAGPAPSPSYLKQITGV